MLQTLSNELLVERFGKLVRTERKISHLVIACIAEIEIRKIYLDRAYPSLFEYLTKEFGYSESAAYRRISAARLFRQVPEIAQKIETGRINLSQASLLVQTVRAAEKSSAQPVTKVQKLKILEMIEDKSFQHSHQIIHRELGVTVQEPQRSRTNGDGSLTITLTLTPEQAARWQQVAELTSHAVESHNPAALLDYLAQKEIARRTEIKRASPIRKSPSRNPRLIAPNVRKVVLRNSPSSHVDSTTTTSKSLNAMIPLKSAAAPKIVRFSEADPTKDSDSSTPEANPSSRTELAQLSGASAAKVNLLPDATPFEGSGPLLAAKDSRNESSVMETKVNRAGCNYHEPGTGRRCGSRYFLQVDHQQPVWAGGSRDLANLQALCGPHNRRKYQQVSRIVTQHGCQS